MPLRIPHQQTIAPPPMATVTNATAEVRRQRGAEQPGAADEGGEQLVAMRRMVPARAPRAADHRTRAERREHEAVGPGAGAERLGDEQRHTHLELPREHAVDEVHPPCPGELGVAAHVRDPVAQLSRLTLLARRRRALARPDRDEGHDHREERRGIEEEAHRDAGRGRGEPRHRRADDPRDVHRHEVDVHRVGEVRSDHELRDERLLRRQLHRGHDPEHQRHHVDDRQRRLIARDEEPEQQRLRAGDRVRDEQQPPLVDAVRPHPGDRREQRHRRHLEQHGQSEVDTLAAEREDEQTLRDGLHPRPHRGDGLPGQELPVPRVPDRAEDAVGGEPKALLTAQPGRGQSVRGQSVPWRSSFPGVSSVHSPSTNVVTPLTMVRS